MLINLEFLGSTYRVRSWGPQHGLKICIFTSLPDGSDAGVCRACLEKCSHSSLGLRNQGEAPQTRAGGVCNPAHRMPSGRREREKGPKGGCHQPPPSLPPKQFCLYLYSLGTQGTVLGPPYMRSSYLKVCDLRQVLHLSVPQLPLL